jgi:acetylornithine deacetylase/succinyl-diaminopimelate desuccinylase-like protein
MIDTALRDEATELLSDLIRIDTTNPPGRETAAATFLKAFLEREGIECELVAREPDRANLIARIRGTGEGPSIALLGHTDVVYADAEDWSVPPFSGEVRDGWVWGRGALDMKNHTAANALALARLARSGFQPRGDVLLIAEADEEDGKDHVGLDWLVSERPDLQTDYAINEGAGERLELSDGRIAYLFATAEKATMPVRVIVRGVAGHAAVPAWSDNALLKLGPVLDRLALGQPRLRPSPELYAMLDVLVPGDAPLEERVAEARTLHPVLDAYVPPMQGSTLTPTMTSASRKRNVVPARAELILDCRTLPGTTEAELYAEIRHILGDLEVELEPHEAPDGGTRSPLGTVLEDACRSYIDRLEPGALLVPCITTGFTNSHWVRQAFGTIAYGFMPLRHTDPALAAAVIHSADERVHQDDVAVAVEYLEHVVREVTGGTP